MQENNENKDISKDKINSTSALINDIYNKNIEDNIKVGTLLKSIDSGGFALLNLIFSIILMIPLPPPIAIIAGLIIMFLSFQMIIGMKEVWLPKIITEKSIKRSTLTIIVEKSTVPVGVSRSIRTVLNLNAPKGINFQILSFNPLQKTLFL